MTINAYGTIPKLQRRLHGGPLGVHIDLYAARLLKELSPAQVSKHTMTFERADKIRSRG